MKTRIYIMVLALSFFAVISAFAAKEDAGEKADASQAVDANAVSEKAEPQIDMEKVSYIIGTQIGSSIKTQGIEIDIEMLISGLKDALAGKELALSDEESKQVMMAFRKRMMAKQAAERAQQAAKNLAEGQAFLEKNKAKEGVKVLPSGLQYKVITEGTGETPKAEDKVRTHYRGTLLDGKDFDSSYKSNKPSEFLANRVIKGWREALQLMKVGSKWELYIPAELAYGERGKPPVIPPNATLIFEIELLDIVK